MLDIAIYTYYYKGLGRLRQEDYCEFDDSLGKREIQGSLEYTERLCFLRAKPRKKMLCHSQWV